MTLKRVAKEIHATVDGSCFRRRVGVGVVVRVRGEGGVAGEVSARRGYGTNNTAEYLAVIEACQYVSENFEYGKLTVFTDSQLVFRQLSGEYKVKNKDLRVLHRKTTVAMKKARAFLRWHSREDADGPAADKLANRAVGGRRGTRHRSEVDTRGHRKVAPASTGRGGSSSDSTTQTREEEREDGRRSVSG